MQDPADSRLSDVITPIVFCRACTSPLVQALDWEREDEASWRVRLWCPECHHEQSAALDHSQVLYLSLAMEEGFAWMLDALTEFDSIASKTIGLDFVHRAQTDRLPTLRR